MNGKQTSSFDSEGDYRTGCRNVSHCRQQQSYSGLRSPGRSNSTYLYTFSTVLFELSGSLSLPVISSAPCYYKPSSFFNNFAHLITEYSVNNVLFDSLNSATLCLQKKLPVFTSQNQVSPWKTLLITWQSQLIAFIFSDTNPTNH